MKCLIAEIKKSDALSEKKVRGGEDCVPLTLAALAFVSEPSYRRFFNIGVELGNKRANQQPLDECLFGQPSCEMINRECADHICSGRIKMSIDKSTCCSVYAMLNHQLVDGGLEFDFRTESVGTLAENGIIWLSDFHKRHGSTTVYAPTEREQAVLEFLKDGPATAETIAERLGISRRTLFGDAKAGTGVLRRLQKHGLIRKCGQDGYELVAKSAS
jgi:hypothetical protein